MVSSPEDRNMIDVVAAGNVPSGLVPVASWAIASLLVIGG
jgi:hypothetical protein